MRGRTLLVLMASACMALGGVAWAAPGSTPAEAPTKARGLLAALEDPSPDIVAGALLVLLEDDEVGSSLDPAFEQQLRAFARGPRIAELLRAKDSVIRGSVLDLLARFGEVSPEVVPLVRKQVEDSDSLVQGQAIRALARVEGKTQLLTHLVGLLRDGRRGGAGVAAAATQLQRLGPLAGPHAAEIAQLLHHAEAPRA